VTDLCVIEFTEDLPSDFFKDSVYLIDEKMVATSEAGHELLVAGVLKNLDCSAGHRDRVLQAAFSG
jgi:hypothetical protein